MVRLQRVLALAFLTLVHIRKAQSQDNNLWQFEYDLYQCGDKDNSNPNSCFCGYLEDQILIGDKTRNQLNSDSAGPSACYEGFACTPLVRYPCSNVELLSLVGLTDLNSASAFENGRANDVWGWADPDGSLEVAIIGLQYGTSFVDVTDPTQPVFLGHLPLHGGSSSSWADIKTYGNYAYIVSEAFNHGMQVFDLTILRTASPNTVFTETAHYDLFGNSHNIFIHEETAVAYVVGSRTCSEGLHMIDLSDPVSPEFLGCFAGDGYTHDVQCVIYHGDDTSYTGSEICFACNENTVTVIDVSNKTAPVMLSRTAYTQIGYTHQGWLTEDHNYFLFGDETDERSSSLNTRTLVLDVSKLNETIVTGSYLGPTNAIDHNQYIMGGMTYQANYRAGLRILEIVDPSNAVFEEQAYFDIYPPDDRDSFNGAWSTYPYLPSGVILLSVIEQGLFVLRWNQDGVSTQSNAQCLDEPEEPEEPEEPSKKEDKSCKFDLFFVICFVKKILFAIFDFLVFWD